MKLHNFEANFLGKLLNDNLIDHDLTEDHFTDVVHKKIFREIQTLMSKGETADVVSVGENVGFEHLTNLIEIALPNGWERAIPVIKKNYVKRKMNLILAEAETPEEAISRLMAIDRSKDKYAHALSESLKEMVHHMDKLHTGEIEPGIPSGVRRFDEVTGGFHDSDLIVIGGRPAMGKTALLVNMILNNPKPSLFVSSEQGAMQIAQRITAIKGRVPNTKLRNANMNPSEWDAMARGVSLAKDFPLTIYDNPEPTLADVEKEARRMLLQGGCSAIYLDYLQRMGNLTKHDSDRSAVKENVKGLKSLAKKLNIPIVTLAQVNRDCEKRMDRRPFSSDIADCSEIEKEADVICFLYRDHVYTEEPDTARQAELIMRKNRHGPIGTVWMDFDGPTMTFKGVNNG